MTGTGLFLNFYSEEQALRSIDFDTIGLLLGMMILVAMLEKTGFFQYLAVGPAYYRAKTRTLDDFAWNGRLRYCQCFWTMSLQSSWWRR